jgi:hypothetical protein
VIISQLLRGIKNIPYKKSSGNWKPHQAITGKNKQENNQ